MSLNEINIKSSTGRNVICNYWACSNPKGLVVIAHGMAEHGLRYGHFANYLNQNKYDVYMLDHIGHGKNKYHGRGIWSRHGFDKCVANIKVLIDLLKEKKLPLYLMGNSMGSFMVQKYISTYDTTNIEKIVLIGSSGPQGLYKMGSFVAKLHAIGKDKKAPSKFLNKLCFSSYNNKITPQRTEFDWLTRDEAIVDKYIQDPDCGFIPSVNFFVSFTENLASLHSSKNLKKIRKDMPILLIAGDADPVSNYGKTLIKLNKIYNRRKIINELILYKDYRHEILNEIGKERVYSDILYFINK